MAGALVHHASSSSDSSNGGNNDDEGSGSGRKSRRTVGDIVTQQVSSSSSPFITLNNDPSFEMLVLGCGGGPSENDLSAYWIKPARQRWSDGFTSVDGGSCLGALMRLLVSHPTTFHDFESRSDHIRNRNDHATTTAAAAAAATAPPPSQSASLLLQAGYIYSLLQAFLITHAHWDHISGLVLSSGSGSSQQKTVYGSKQTISNLSNAMDGGLWPVLGSYEAVNSTPYLWRDVDYGKTVQPSKGLSASIMPVSHGQHHQGTPYESSAYFIEDDRTKKTFLIFGDVEPDSVSALKLNKDIWGVAGQKIANGSLSTIFIECSYCSSRAKEQLYGHLSPIYLAHELAALAAQVPSATGEVSDSPKGRLKGVTVCIIHVKPPTSESEILEASGSSTIYYHTPAPSSGTSTEALGPLPKKRKASNAPLLDLPATDASIPSSRKTRSASTKGAPSSQVEQSPQSSKKTLSQSPPSQASGTTVLEGIKAKIYEELQALEARDQLGVRYLMLEQGMRISF